MSKFFNARTALAGFAAAAALNAGAQADQVFADDVIIRSSLCVGNDCVNGEIFSFDTIRLKENNTRIAFDDTSTSGSFPNVDWELQANESANGGANRFAFIDRTNGRTIFVMEAASPNNSLYIDRTGNIGVGTATPVLPLHVVDGNSPALRLEQDGSAGFTAQTWDVAGNETNFFVRDVTNGGRLPFRIIPGAPTNSLYVDSDGDIGVGTNNPQAAMHVVDGNNTNTVPGFKLSGPGTNFSDIESVDGGPTQLRLISTDSNRRIVAKDTEATVPDGQVYFPQSGGVTIVGGGNIELATFTDDGNLTLLSGGLISVAGGGSCTVADPCDGVFDPETYTVPSIEEHAALMWESRHLPAVGPTGPGIPINVTEKMLRMLNELEHAHIFIQQLNTELQDQRAELNELRETVATTR